MIYITIVIFALISSLNAEDYNNQKLVDLLYGVEPQKRAALSEKQNIVLFLTDTLNIPKNFQDANITFATHGFAKGDNILDMGHRGLPRDVERFLKGSQQDCEHLVSSSTQSLLGWALNSQGMSTGRVVATDSSTFIDIQSPDGESEESIWSHEGDTIKEPKTQTEQSTSGSSVRQGDDHKQTSGEKKKMSNVEDSEIRILPMFDKDSNEETLLFGPIRRGRSEVYITSPERKSLIQPRAHEHSKYDDWNLFDGMRQSFMDNFMRTIGLAHRTEQDIDINQIGTIKPPSFYHLVKDSLDQVKTQSRHSKDNGYLLVLEGGRDARDVLESLKYVLTNTPSARTMVVVSGTCQQKSSEALSRKSRYRKKVDDRIPYYATGLNAKHLSNINQLYELPKAIKNAFTSATKHSHSSDDDLEKPIRSVQQDFETKQRLAKEMNDDKLKLDYYRHLIDDNTGRSEFVSGTSRTILNRFIYLFSVLCVIKL